MARSSKFLTSQKAKALDIKARETFGVPTLILMENAGRQIALEAMKTLSTRKKIAIFCGKGNNGGDGFAAARHLLTNGIRCDIFLAGTIKEVRGEARVNLDILLNLKQKIIEISKKNLQIAKMKIATCPLIIDALLGVGLKGQVRGIFRDLIVAINSSKAYILSVDIPSGLDATTGRVLGCCIKADKTVTFVAKKRGMAIADGPKYCGRIRVCNLGVPL